MSRNIRYNARVREPVLLRPHQPILGSMDRTPRIYHHKDAKIITRQLEGRDAGIFFGFPFGLADNFCGSHLAEHLFFRRTGKRLGVQVDEAIERVGGYYTGYTDVDIMGFPILFPANKLTDITRIFRACLKERKVNPKHLRLEKSVVCGELDQRWSDPESYRLEAEQKILFPDHPLALKRETKKWYNSLTLEDIEEVNENKLGTINLHVGIVGPNIPKLLDSVKRLLDVMPYSGNDMPEFKSSKLTKNKLTVTRPGVQDISTYLSFIIDGDQSPDLPALRLMLHLLEGGDAQDYMISSRLFRALRTETGVVYHTDSDLDHRNGVGYMSLCCLGTQNKNAGHVEKIFLGEIQKLRETYVPEEELNQVKKSFRLTRARNTRFQCDPVDIAETLVLAEFYKTPNTEREYVSEIEQVTSEDIKRVANKYASNNKLLLSVLRGN